MLRLALSALVVLAACGDTTASIDDPAEFLAELRTAECDRLVTCHVFADVAQCEARLSFPGLPHEIWISPPGDEAWLGHVEAGTMAYSGERAALCIQEMRSPVCGRYEPGPACFGVFRGIAPAGAVTSSPEQCDSRSWESSECEGTCCTGTCAARSDDGVLVDGSGGAEGDRCGVIATGFESCQSRLACRDSRCVRLGDRDECLGNTECPAGKACDGGTCVPRREIGETCRRLIGGEDTCDHVGAWCDFTDTCRALALEGEACNNEGEAADLELCRAGLQCAAGRCAAVLAQGELCDVYVPCAEGLYCGGITDAGVVCAPKLAGGADCSENWDCASGRCDPSGDQPVCAPVVTCP
jgi:hypothetical protein